MALVLGAAGAPAGLRAQEDSLPGPPVPRDTAEVAAPEGAERAAAEPESTSGVLGRGAPDRPAPMGAFFRSVVFPGWGQYYADQPMRGVVYTAVHAANVFMVVRTQRRIDDAESDELKDARREQREDWLVWAGFWMLASGVDAWVSAQMWDFEGEVVPPPDGSAGLALRLRLPVRSF